MLKRITIIIFLSIFLYIIPPGGFSAWSFESGVRWLYLFIVSFLIFNLLYPLLVKIAYKFRILDIPDSRKIHHNPVPRIGGLGIYIAFIATVIRNNQFSDEIIGIIVGSSVIFLSGFIDDIKSLPAHFRLFLQILASTIVFFSGLKITYTLHWGLAGSIISYIITVLWIVGITNTFNFLDGIDGLSSTLAIIISVIFLIVVVKTNQYKVMFVTSSLVGALSGFIIYNWNPAKTFLGDGGSNFVGFLLACLGIYASWAHNNPVVALSTPIIILFIPIFDVVYITISRIKNGQVKNIKQWLEYTGKDHFHHRLLALGFSVKSAVFFISLLNILLGIIALNLVINEQSIRTYLSLVQTVLIFMIIVNIMVIARNKVVNNL